MGHAGLLGCLLLIGSSADQRNPDLSRGIAQVNQGEFEEALINLDLAARRLSNEPGHGKDLAQAYFHMGVAYLSMGQEGLALAKFRQAIRSDRELRPGPDEFARRVLRVFEAARQAEAEEAGLQKQAGRRRGKGGLILLGIGGAAGVAVGVSVATRERNNLPPTASITRTPEGLAIPEITKLTFTATATDPEGDPLSYAWAFGDNRSAEGPTVTHIFGGGSGYDVTLTVHDGLTFTSASTRITTGTLSGRWRADALIPFGVTEYEIDNTSGGGHLEGFALGPGFQGHFFGTVRDPRAVTINGNIPSCNLDFRGDAAGDLRTISGAAQCSGGGACRCAGQQLSVTLVRQ